MVMKTTFSPELVKEMGSAYDICTELLGKTVRQEDIAQHIINSTAFGIDNAVEMALMTVNYLRFKSQLVNRKLTNPPPRKPVVSSHT